MDDISIREALSQVERVRSVLLERRQFQGYSGWARLMGAVVVIFATWILSLPSMGSEVWRQTFGWTPGDEWIQFFGWTVVVGLAGLLNYGALMIWFWREDSRRREGLRLQPEEKRSLFRNRLTT